MALSLLFNKGARRREILLNVFPFSVRSEVKNKTTSDVPDQTGVSSSANFMYKLIITMKNASYTKRNKSFAGPIIDFSDLMLNLEFEPILSVSYYDRII